MLEEHKCTVRITYDRTEDMAYIFFDDIKQAEITDSVIVEDSPNRHSDLVLDFAGTKLKGIEVIGAKSILPDRLISNE